MSQFSRTGTGQLHPVSTQRKHDDILMNKITSYIPVNREAMPHLHFHAHSFFYAFWLSYTFVLYPLGTPATLLPPLPSSWLCSSVTLPAIPCFPHYTIASGQKSMAPTNRQCSPVGTEINNFCSLTPDMHRRTHKHAQHILYRHLIGRNTLTKGQTVSRIQFAQGNWKLTVAYIPVLPVELTRLSSTY